METIWCSNWAIKEPEFWHLLTSNVNNLSVGIELAVGRTHNSLLLLKVLQRNPAWTNAGKHAELNWFCRILTEPVLFNFGILIQYMRSAVFGPKFGNCCCNRFLARPLWTGACMVYSLYHGRMHNYEVEREVRFLLFVNIRAFLCFEERDCQFLL